MALAKRLLNANEDHAKKHDDRHGSSHIAAGSLSRVWRGQRRKRILLGLVGVWLLYMFFKNIPTDVPPVSKRRYPGFGSIGFDTPPPVPEAPPEQSQAGAQLSFEGPIKFYNLASTLRKGSSYDPDGSLDVLFAFSSLKSASVLIPLACEMSRQRRNNVHVAQLGRDGISIDALKDINGITEVDCAVQWHDGRPDYASISSDDRMSASVKASLSHIYNYVRMPAIIVDNALEHAFFTSAMQEKAHELGTTLVALPDTRAENMMWLTRLWSSALRFWNKVQIDIIVHSSAESSASLMRLLRSIQSADYFGHTVPRLTVELPAYVDPPLLEYLSSFSWPPSSSGADTKLVIRRRTSPSRFTPAEASLHTVETFYPANADTSHVLILTPDAELSPSYYHYLMYTILEYKYSPRTTATDKLLGISLELPTKALNGLDSFQLPQAASDTSCFLWQAPNSNAALYFGDKWAEFHSFLSNRLTVDMESGQGVHDTKLVSSLYPAWLEYMLELMRARDYSILYPAFAVGTESSIVTVHQESYQKPEEFAVMQSPDIASLSPKDAVNVLDPTTILTAAVDSTASKKEAKPAGRGSILSFFFRTAVDMNGNASLPSLAQLTTLSFLGETLTPSESIEQSSTFADTFSLAHGGCESLNDRSQAKRWTADDLFCLPDLVPTKGKQAAG